MPAKASNRAQRIKTLQKEEIALKNHAEKVAAKRRALPPGPVVEKDYVFKDGSRTVKLSQLFGRGQNELLLYHFMYAPKDKKPCPMCNMWADGYNAIAKHVGDRAQFVLVAKAPAEKFKKWGKGRGWNNIRLLSSYGTTFNRDFNAEDEDGDQWPLISVFTRDKKGVIRHFYQKSALLDEKNNRGIDLLTPVWNLFDMLPSGRGDWLPKYEYR
ncbi:MAG TPA: DUF899 family protein [Trinickia sp.]|jgi:predicted dithiol-disulfide oxidoreductase (DUF899 family)|nr:DUF899 family protein [Trinickia sp.]